MLIWKLLFIYLFFNWLYWKNNFVFIVLFVILLLNSPLLNLNHFCVVRVFYVLYIGKISMYKCAYLEIVVYLFVFQLVMLEK